MLLQIFSYISFFVSFFTGVFIYWSIHAKTRFRSSVVNVLAARVCITFAVYLQYKCIIRKSWLCWLTEGDETPMLIWTAKLSLTPIYYVSRKELGAVLMIMRFLMYQSSCFLIIANNMALNYDLMQMIAYPFTRNVRKTVNWSNVIATIYILLVYVLIPVIYIVNILGTPDRIILRSEDTVMPLLEPLMFIPDALLCFFYIGFNIKVLMILNQFYFSKRGYNNQIKNLIINRRIMMALIIMIYEGPFLLGIVKRAIYFI